MGSHHSRISALPSVSGAVLYSPKYTGIISMTGFLFGYLEDRGGRGGRNIGCILCGCLRSCCCPIGLGIFGVAPQYHTQYMVLALGIFLTTFPAMLSVPVAVNQVIECFRQHALETSAIMGAYRLTFGLAVLFFCHPMAEGTRCWMGCLAWLPSSALGSFMLPVLLMWRGQGIRNSPSSSQNASTSFEIPSFLDTV